MRLDYAKYQLSCRMGWWRCSILMGRGSLWGIWCWGWHRGLRLRRGLLCGVRWGCRRGMRSRIRIVCWRWGWGMGRVVKYTYTGQTSYLSSSRSQNRPSGETNQESKSWFQGISRAPKMKKKCDFSGVGAAAPKSSQNISSSRFFRTRAAHKWL